MRHTDRCAFTGVVVCFRRQSFLQHILRPDGRVRPILDLQQHRAGFHRHQIVPLPRRDVDERPARDHVDGLRHPPLGIVEVFHEMPPQAHHRLRRRPVPMDGQHRPRLDRVQHPLRLVRRRIPQVQIHPEPRRGLRLGGQGVKGCFVDDHTTKISIYLQIWAFSLKIYYLQIESDTGRINYIL